MKILLLMLGHWMNLNHWENINVQEGKAKTITTALNLLMERRNLHKDNMTGFSRDGTSFMTGKNKWRTINSPFLVGIHCVAHRLALYTSQAANAIPYLAKFKEILTALYCYFDKSAFWSQSLAEVQKIFEHPELKIKCLISGGFHSRVLWRHCTALGSLLWPTWNPNPTAGLSLIFQVDGEL